VRFFKIDKGSVEEEDETSEEDAIEQEDEISEEDAIEQEDEISEEDAIEQDDKIFEVDMTTIDGALQVLVHAAVLDFGPIARDVFEAIFSPGSAFSVQEDALAEVTFDHLEKFCETFVHGTFFPEQTISHHIIAVEPVASAIDDPKFAYQRPKDIWMIDFRTEQIACQMSEKFKELDNERRGKLFTYFRSNAQSSALAAGMLEPIANRILCTDMRHELALFKMDGDLRVDAPVLRVNFMTGTAEKLRLPCGERHEVEFHPARLTDFGDDAYYTPVTSNFPLYDSFLVERQGAGTTMKLILWVFQMSISSKHGGSRKGYESIREIIAWLKTYFGTKGKKKTKKQDVTVKYVYVVPWEKNHTKYEWHCPGGWRKGITHHNHCGEFYCLRIQIPGQTSIPLPPSHKVKTKRTREENKEEGSSKKQKTN